ncbi:MAG: DUF2007 domain-containing protein, partial [Duncaniella sp.]|nr:DUF2007 domain-containing protein [Duncaniella sp.]
MDKTRLITIAIHTYDRAIRLRTILESEGIPVTLHNVNLDNPEVSAGVRLRIAEEDLPRALRLLESIQIISPEISEQYSSGQPTVLLPVNLAYINENAVLTAFSIAALHNA